MASAIDVNMPVHGNPTTASVRENFRIARDEISALQTQVAGLLLNMPYLPLAGAGMTGPMTLAENPAQPMEPATKAYVDGLVATIQQLEARLAALEPK